MKVCFLRLNSYSSVNLVHPVLAPVQEPLPVDRCGEALVLEVACQHQVVGELPLQAKLRPVVCLVGRLTHFLGRSLVKHVVVLLDDVLGALFGLFFLHAFPSLVHFI